MSIYASFGCIDAEEHMEGCGRLLKLRPKGALFAIMFDSGSFWIDEKRKCTCGVGPIKYRGSHILPSDADERGGCLSLAFIPGHIDDSTRKALSESYPPYWPWLRVSIWGTDKDEPTVILTKEQVKRLRDSLNSWLEKAVGEGRDRG